MFLLANVVWIFGGHIFAEPPGHASLGNDRFVLSWDSMHIVSFVRSSVLVVARWLTDSWATSSTLFYFRVQHTWIEMPIAFPFWSCRFALSSLLLLLHNSTFSFLRIRQIIVNLVLGIWQCILSSKRLTKNDGVESSFGRGMRNALTQNIADNSKFSRLPESPTYATFQWSCR